MVNDRFFKFSDTGEPEEVPRTKSGYDFLRGDCARGVTRVSCDDSDPAFYTIHCDGPYFPGALDRLQSLLNAERDAERRSDV